MARRRRLRASEEAQIINSNLMLRNQDGKKSRIVRRKLRIFRRKQYICSEIERSSFTASARLGLVWMTFVLHAFSTLPHAPMPLLAHEILIADPVKNTIHLSSLCCTLHPVVPFAGAQSSRWFHLTFDTCHCTLEKKATKCTANNTVNGNACTKSIQFITRNQTSAALAAEMRRWRAHNAE